MNVKVFTHDSSEESLRAKKVVEKVCQEKNLSWQEVVVREGSGLTEAIQNNILQIPTVIIETATGITRFNGGVNETDLQNALQ